MASKTTAAEFSEQDPSRKSNFAWITERANERATLLQTYAPDPKYKKYTQQVDKCLNSFDNVQEWADCIAFLKQLLKTFQSFMQFKEIPRKLIVAKRLAQCLNPALPAGVHQRALDVYSHILAVLGPEGLERDLPLWSSGLFPFFEYATTSVKPTLLNLYDTHYLPLQGGLRPITKSFILALLPGLEEETGEFFEKVLSLLDRLSGTVSPLFFFQNIWLVMLTTPSARGTSLNLLSRRLPQFNSTEDITTIVGKDIGLMIRAFAAALEDENLLVRRGALDLLLQCMRVDSPAVQRAHPDDRTILMRAAIGVVLRRDLSLNRRLYTWLLGPEEKSASQIVHLRQHALDLLCTTLKQDMTTPLGEYAESRPFKIFISLLDKWEVGGPVSEVLVYDAFEAIKRLVSNADESNDILMTASTLYEAIEPRIVWKELLSRIFSDILGDGSHFEAIQMALFILKSFTQDEEIQSIHLPIVFTALVDLLSSKAQAQSDITTSECARECLSLLGSLLQQIPPSALLSRPELTTELQERSRMQGPYEFACTFYEIQPQDDVALARSEPETPFASSFSSLISLTLAFKGLLSDGKVSSLLREELCQALALTELLLKRSSTTIVPSWSPLGWLKEILECVDHQIMNFTLLDHIVSLLIVMHNTHYLERGLNIDNRTVMVKVVTKLLHYLRPDTTAYHVRAVDLIWSLEAISKHSHVESIVAQTLTSPESRNVQEAYDAFGVLWRLTEDVALPGFKFRVPLMIVLDMLNSDSPSLRRAGETWMRCNLKSYPRVLDPIMYELLDPSVRRTPASFQVNNRDIPGYYYDRPFDQRYNKHLLDLLLAVVRFGGQGLAKTARNTSVTRSHHPGLPERVREVAGFPDPEPTYLDVLVEILLRFLQSEPRDVLEATLGFQNIATHSTAIDLLQTIISRGELDNISLQAVEAVVIGKLYQFVHTAKLDLQNKLLHLLHSLISVLAVGDLQSTAPNPADQNPSGMTYALNPLLPYTLVDGLSLQTNRILLQHWLDFILMAVPQFQPALHSVIAPLNECICRQLEYARQEALQMAVMSNLYDDDPISTATDTEFVMLLNSLERLVLLSLAYAPDSSAVTEEESSSWEKTPVEGNTGLLGIVSTVFSTGDGSNAQSDQLTSRSPGFRALYDGVYVLHSIWGSLSVSTTGSPVPKSDSKTLVYSRARNRCRRVLERFFHVHSLEVFESIIDCWNKQPLGSNVSSEASFQLVDVLVASAQNAVHMLCECIASRLPGATERSRKSVVNTELSDVVLFDFLEQYLRRLEGPLVLQVWGRFLQLMKDILGHTKDFKPQTFWLLRCVVVMGEKLTQTTAIEDRKLRKDLQDTFGKALDICVVYAGKPYESGSWIRRTTKDNAPASGRDSPVSRNDSKLDEKSSPLIGAEVPRMGFPEEIIDFIVREALPNVRRFLLDTDKVLAACNNIVYYIVGPGTKAKSRPLDVDPSIVVILLELSRIPAALKAWRPPLLEIFNDNRLFNSSVTTADQWRPIIKSLYNADKTAFPELLGKVTTTPSTNIFTNKEYEMLLRSMNLRRLSLVLLTGEKNQFVTQLPSIQEKLVDILRNVASPVVQSEVYLCIRVLLCRLSAHNLTSFWPVLLTELYRLFDQVMTSPPADGSEDLPLLLAGSKCLDLLLTLQTEEFQIHQWMFITDTIDAIYRPNEWHPDALLDQLSDVIANLPQADNTTSFAAGIHPSTLTTVSNSRPMRSPLLNSIQRIESVQELVPFFSSVSISSYEGVYTSGGNVDWEAVERGLMLDMFDGP